MLMNAMLRGSRAVILLLALCGELNAAETISVSSTWLASDGLTHRDRISAFLDVPAVAGPRPAIIMMHGCGGLLTGRGQPQKKYRHWAERFQRAGFATLAVDSFTGRNIREICTGKEKLPASRARTADARAALVILQAEPRIDPKQIGLIGWSNGGRVVLHLLDRPQPAEGGFRFAVGFYANALVVSGPERTRPFLPSIPLLLLSGEADDWTPARNVLSLQAATRRAGGDFTVHLFPQAHHSFDSIGAEIRYRPDVRNASKPGGCCGATIGYNAAATLTAEGVMMAWINKILRQN
ncbi:hypothetical protein GH722_09570 [Alphaproteobacteria bacterium HT1-32]|nr:hypothetical protein [Alphaproteobacteria bacterium HT1-32]